MEKSPKKQKRGYHNSMTNSHHTCLSLVVTMYPEKKNETKCDCWKQA